MNDGIYGKITDYFRQVQKKQTIFLQKKHNKLAITKGNVWFDER